MCRAQTGDAFPREAMGKGKGMFFISIGEETTTPTEEEERGGGRY